MNAINLKELHAKIEKTSGQLVKMTEVLEKAGNLALVEANADLLRAIGSLTDAGWELRQTIRDQEEE